MTSKQSYGRSVKRSRQCVNCGHRFVTLEQQRLSVDAKVRKFDGRIMYFDPNRLEQSLRKAIGKSPCSETDFDVLFNKILVELNHKPVSEIPTTKIESVTFRYLREFMPIGALRYKMHQRNMTLNKLDSVLEKVNSDNITE